MTAPTRHGDWMMTASGRTFWPLDPRPEEIHLADIAHSLARQCRYAGHTRDFFSVAQHSVLVAMVLPPDFKAWGLLHDASEAYLVDLPRPVKRFITGYAEAEDRLMRCIAERFDLPWPMPQEVKEADNAILADEMSQIMPYRPEGLGPGWNVKVDPLPPDEAEMRFLVMADKVLGRAGQ